MREDEERQYYTVPEAARALDVSPATIWRWIEARRLPAYRVGPRRIRIRKQDLQTVIRPVQPTETPTGREEEAADIWSGYDAEQVRAALRKSAGALAGVDRETLRADVRAARAQESAGRPT